MAAEEDAFECLAKLRAEYRINHRIERRVEVAEPEEERGERFADLAGAAQRLQERHEEEGHPADDERTRDDR